MELDTLFQIWGKLLSDPGELINSQRSASEALKVLLLPLGMGMALLWHRLPQRVGRGLLVGLVVLTTLNYARWGPDLITRKVDPYDLIHYYLNAKYFDELGYYDLYPAAIVADHANGGPHFEEGSRYMAQNEAGHGFRPIQHALERGAWVRDTRFTPERWAAFEHDFLNLQRETHGLNDKIWREMIQDHGYNGTPVWTILARPLASVVPVESVKLLGYLDLGLLVGATAVTAWAFGGPAAGFLWVFLMTSYSLRWPTITWSYLRYDYMAALIIAMGLLKKGHHFWAGVLTGYSAVLRLFPAVWLYGPGMKGLAGLLQRKIQRPLVVLLVGFLVGAAALEGAAVLRLGPEQAQVHFENMRDHNSSEQLSSRRIGLALALPYHPGQDTPKYIEDERKATIEAQKPLRYGIALLTMLALGWGLRNAKDEETFAFGFVPFFLLTTASYYYYVARATLLIMHAGDLSRLRNRVGLAVLLGLELWTNWAEVVLPGQRVFLIGGLSWGIMGYILLMAGWFLVESYTTPATTPQDSRSG